MTPFTEGHLREISAGRWRCDYRMAGRRMPALYVDAKGKREAKSAVYEQKQALIKQAEIDATWTVGKLGEAWITAHLPSVGSPKTRELYAYQVRHYLAGLKAHRLAELTAFDIDDFVEEDLAGLAASTVGDCLRRLRQMLSWAVSRSLVTENVALLVGMPAKEEPTRKPFSVPEFKAMLAAVEGPEQAVLVLGALGLRRAEAIGLPRAEVLLPARVLNVKQQLQQNVRQNVRVESRAKAKRADMILPPKEGRTREVPIPEWAVPYLEDQVAFSEKYAGPGQLLLVSPLRNGKPASWDLSLTVRKACDLAGIDRQDRCFHSLRHSCAIWGREAGTPDVELARILGHKDTSMLVKLYGNHPNPSRNRQIASEMDAYFGDVRPVVTVAA